LFSVLSDRKLKLAKGRERGNGKFGTVGIGFEYGMNVWLPNAT